MDVDNDGESVREKLKAIDLNNDHKERATEYMSVLDSLLQNGLTSSTPLITFAKHFIHSNTLPMVTARRVFDSLVLVLCAGTPLQTVKATEGEDEKWLEKGKNAFAGENGHELRREAVEGVREAGQGVTWCDEQMTTLSRLEAHLLEQEEDWLGAARALIRIPLEGTSRMIPDEEKVSVYVKIVRLLLECQEWGQAQTYFSRASLLIHTCHDKETLLAYRLSQARLFDFSARFNEAAQRYHEISFESIIDEEDRLQMLKAAVTTSILAPAGPQRSRILAALNRDDRVHSSLPPALSTMLRKMLLEYIVRPEEVREFELGLEEHQRATVEGGGTVLERAVRDHNVGACGKVYDNVSFDALASILGLDADSAEITARKMIEQGRLRAWIDQPLHLLYFESRVAHDTDADAQGTAGGLGVERVEKEVEPVSWTERWDDRIRATSMKVEALAAAIQAKNLITPA
ncbi:putative COP9 signalosome complex subunit 4 [Kockovaella imperatae]|uniref:COP9 signalosome complex subunit 4 n=1 Tax=Kockovaella imperatae TaxID=4999 RepID=A0A1Y1USV0_9TREE|nr:putative COP9 signalosome complex subunit 4 [Kockovaella imperatae]ORX40506.1 putative COP9 signalosome complex subunit 4 [Kockovaella imperatae]